MKFRYPLLQRGFSSKDISEGIKCILKNKHVAIKKTLEGQKYVLKNYNLDVVAKKWKLLIKEFV